MLTLISRLLLFDFLERGTTGNQSPCRTMRAMTIQEALAQPQFHTQPHRQETPTILSRQLLADGVLMDYKRCSGPFYNGRTDPTDGPSRPTAGSEYRFPVAPQPWTRNRHNSMHGGLIAALLDTLIGVHLFLALGAPTVFPGVTVHFSLSYVRPVPIVATAGDRTPIATFHTKLHDLSGDSNAIVFDVWVTNSNGVPIVCGRAIAMTPRLHQLRPSNL